MRIFLLALAMGLHVVQPLSAQEWPQRAVTLVVPFAAGSTPDNAARIIGDRLGAKLGQPVVIENKPGASGNLGTNSVAKAAPDGYTIGVSIVGPLALNTLLFPSMPYDPKKDLTLITVLVSQPSVLVVNGALDIKSADDLLAFLKRDGAKVNFGSIGNGSLSHLAMEAIAISAGAKLVHIPYSGSPAVLTDLIRGDVQLSVLPMGAVAPLAAAGKIKLIAITSSERSKLLPSVPTLAEVGIRDVEADSWIGLIAPANLHETIRGKLEAAVREVLGEEAVKDKLRTQYMTTIGSTPQQFRARIDAELDRWGPVIKANNIRISQ